MTQGSDLPLSPRFQVTDGNDATRELDAYTEDGFRALAELWTRSNWERRLSYDVSWLGMPIIQLPEDILMMQELIWDVRPDVIVESGVAHGGSLVLYASMLELIGSGRVVGMDVEIRPHNRRAIEAHPLSDRISLIEGDSVAEDTVQAVREKINPNDRVLVTLDSDHSKSHVLAELEHYAPLVTPGSYVVVFDGVMPLLADSPSGSPEWRDDNPLAAVTEYMHGRSEFEADPRYTRLLVTYCQSGYWRRLED